MARAKDSRWKISTMPEWKQVRAFANPPQKYRRLWRQEYRSKSNRALRDDPEDFQYFPMNRVTNTRDWY